MIKIFTKNKKYFSWLLLFAVVLSFVILPAIVLAQDTGGAARVRDSSWVGQFISWISGKVLLFASSMISMVLSTFFGVII